jgi:PAS domain S-box-containing protein
MKLQRKTTLILFGAIAIMMVFNLVLFREVITHNFADVEADTVRRDVAQVVDTIENEISTMGNQASDYAYWDETRDYVEKREPAYIETNFRSDQFAQYLKSVDYVLIYDNNGELILSRGYDHKTNVESNVPVGLLNELASDDRFIKHPDDKDKVSGMILTGGGPFLVTSFPIVNSAMKGPVRGALIFAARIDDSRIQEWSRKLQTSLAIFRSDERVPDAYAQSALAVLKDSADVYLHPVPGNRIAGYVLLRDLRDTQALLLRVDKPRTIYEQGVWTIYYLAFGILITGLVVGVLILYLLGKTVLTPIAALLSILEDIERSADIKRRIPVRRRDELGELGEGINRTLDSLEKSDTSVRASENRLRAITDCASDAILVIDYSGIITFWNPAAEKTFGFAASEILGQRVYTLFGSEYAWKEHFQQIFDGIPSVEDSHDRASIELVAVTKCGTQFPCELSLSAFSADETSPTVVIIRDVSLRKRAEEHVAESNARFNQLARESRSLIWEIDINGMYVYISDVSELVMGYRADEVIGKMHFYDFHPEEDRRQFKARAFDRFAHRESFSNYEHRIVTRDKKTLWLSTNGIPFYDRDDNLEGYRGMSTDITDRKAAEEERSTLEAQLRQAHKMESVGRLAGGVAHDFNNMLSVILGYAEVGLAQVVEGTRVYVSLTEIHKAAMRSADLTRRLL